MSRERSDVADREGPDGASRAGADLAGPGTVALRERAFDGSLAADLAARPPCTGPGAAELRWLGQAGFAIDVDGRRLLIDPYLSDSLARRHANGRWSHARLMPAPIPPEALEGIDLVLCTHRHGDHMDPDTLAPLARSHPDLQFVVPAASVDAARMRADVGDDRLVPVDAGEAVEPLPGVRVRAVAAAHERLEVDAAGRHVWLGYAIEAAGLAIYHSGDTVPYPGLAGTVRALAPDLALLPVNGRDAERLAAGVPGNLTLDEATALCRQAGVGRMIAHHHGMFAFNTIAAEEIDARVAPEAAAGLALVRARTGRAWRLGTG